MLKPGGFFVFDVLDAETPLAENWAILETYLGAEVFLESAADWKKQFRQLEGPLQKVFPANYSSFTKSDLRNKLNCLNPLFHFVICPDAVLPIRIRLN